MLLHTVQRFRAKEDMFVNSLTQAAYQNKQLTLMINKGLGDTTF